MHSTKMAVTGLMLGSVALSTIQEAASSEPASGERAAVLRLLQDASGQVLEIEEREGELHRLPLIADSVSGAGAGRECREAREAPQVHAAVLAGAPTCRCRRLAQVVPPPPRSD